MPPQPPSSTCCRFLGLWRAALAELLGTFLINLLLGPASGHLDQTRTLDVFFYGVLYACVTVNMTLSMREVSGGHLNPAVTAAMLVSRRINVGRAALFLAAQCSGGVMGSALIYLLLRDKYVGSTSVDDKLDIAQAFGMETLGTFLYVFSFFAAMDRNRKEGASGGSPPLLFMSFFTAAIFTRPYTGGSLNPIRSLGPSIIESKWNRHWVFWLGPLVGGSVGGFLYDLVFAANASRRRALSFISDADYDADNLYDVIVHSNVTSASGTLSSRRHQQTYRTGRKSHREQRSRSSSHLGVDETSLTYEKMASV